MQWHVLYLSHASEVAWKRTLDTPPPPSGGCGLSYTFVFVRIEGQLSTRDRSISCRTLLRLYGVSHLPTLSDEGMCPYNLQLMQSFSPYDYASRVVSAPDAEK